MASTIKVDKIEGSTGSTVTVPTGQTLTVTDGLAIGSIPTITVAKGGTNTTSYTTGDTVYASGATAISKLGIGTARQGLQTNSGASAPEWADSPQSLMTAAGDILYASGANTLAKLAKGSDTEVLTLASGVPSWAAAGGGAWTFISSTALDAATISVTGLDSTYDKYQFVLSDVHVDTESSGSQYIWARAIQGGSAVTSSDYIYSATSYTSSASYGGYASGGNDIFLIANNGTSLPTAEVIDITLDIYHPGSTTTWLGAFWQKIGYTHDNRDEINMGGGQLKTTAATTGIQFGLQSGVFDGGNVRLYGLTNSQEIIMTRFIRIGNVRRQMTAEEESAKDADEAQMAVKRQAAADTAAQQATDKTNGNQKLLDLGLTQAEVDALTGQ